MSKTRSAPAAVAEARTSDHRLAVIALSALALLQAPIVLASWEGWFTLAISIGLAVSSVYVRLSVLRMLAPIIVINFVVHLARVATPIPFRLAHVAILAGYGAMGLAGLATLLLKRPFSSALTVSAALAGTVLAAEAVIPFMAPASMISDAGVRWRAAPPLNPTTNQTSAPYAILQSIYPDNPRGYFEQWHPPSGEVTKSPRYAIGYSLNALGCRGRDYPIPKPAGRRRIVVLGSSTAFGEGVLDKDTFAERLERSLNAAEKSPNATYEVINCAAPGLSTREQREFYVTIASRYEPDLVIAAASVRDNLSRIEEWQEGFVHRPARYEYLLLLARLIQYARHQGERPFEYSGSADQLLMLHDICRARSVQMVVVAFPDKNSEHALRMATTITSKLQPAEVPFLDLGPTLMKDHAIEALMVHRLDDSLNDVAHEVSSNEIEKFLRRLRLIG